MPAGFLFNGALSTYEKLGFNRDRKIGKHRWVLTRSSSQGRRRRGSHADSGRSQSRRRLPELAMRRGRSQIGEPPNTKTPGGGGCAGSTPAIRHWT